MIARFPAAGASTIVRMLGEVLTAVVTPFAADGAVELDRFRALCRHLVENGSDGVVVTGTTGEAPTLTDEERFALYEAAVDEVGGTHTVVAGTGTYDTAHSVHLTERAHEIGVDGFLVVTPYYNKPPQRGSSRTSPPSRPRPTGRSSSTTSRAASSSTPSRRRSRRWRRSRTSAPSSRRSRRSMQHATSSRRVSTSTPATTTSSTRSSRSGESAAICVHTHIVGPQVKEMIPRYRAGDLDGARAIDEELRPAIDLLRVQTNPIPIKTALNLLGHDVGGFRLPLVDATAEEEAAVRDCLERLGLLQPLRRLTRHRARLRHGEPATRPYTAPR